MPRRKKETEDIELFKYVETIIGRQLSSKESSQLAYSARNFVRDNYAVTDVYDADTIEESFGTSGKDLDDENAWVPEDEAIETDDYSGHFGGKNE